MLSDIASCVVFAVVIIIVLANIIVVYYIDQVRRGSVLSPTQQAIILYMSVFSMVLGIVTFFAVGYSLVNGRYSADC